MRMRKFITHPLIASAIAIATIAAAVAVRERSSKITPDTNIWTTVDRVHPHIWIIICDVRVCAQCSFNFCNSRIIAMTIIIIPKNDQRKYICISRKPTEMKESYHYESMRCFHGLCGVQWAIKWFTFCGNKCWWWCCCSFRIWFGILIFANKIAMSIWHRLHFIASDQKKKYSALWKCWQ